MEKSVWLQENTIKKYSKIKQDLECDVLIVGGGITGITTAYNLALKKYNVILVEKDRLMSKTSGNTTAKVTSQHGLMYKYLADNFGLDYAKSYFRANEEAIKNIKSIIDKEKIECDFKEENSYVYTKSNQSLEKIKDEVKIAKEIGVKASYEEKIPLPIANVLGAIKFENQAQFNPIKYAQGLCVVIEKNNGKIFEDSNATEIKKKDTHYETKVDENIIKSKNVIYATRYSPQNIPGFYFLKTYQAISYCECFEFSEEPFEGMYINAEEPTLSAKILKLDDKKVLMVTGCTKKVGKEGNICNPYLTLEAFAHSIFPSAKQINKWSTEDTISLDKIAYIRRIFKIYARSVYSNCF